MVLFNLVWFSILRFTVSVNAQQRSVVVPIIHPLCDELVIPPLSSTYLWTRHSHTSSSAGTTTATTSGTSIRTSARYLQSGIRTRPRWSYWQQLLDAIHSHQQPRLDPKALHVGVLTLPSESGMVEYWQQELLHLSVGNKNFNFTIHLTAFLEEPDCNNGQDPCRLDNNLDLLIDARSHGVQASNANVYSTMLVPNYDTELSGKKQSWIRQWLQNTQTVLILLDPTIGNALWQNMEHTRTLQLLADWYQIPFLSLASHASQEHHPWKLALELVMYAFLDFTILHCHGSRPSTIESPLLKSVAQYRAEYVLPPPLDATLSWQDVTRRWESAHYGKESNTADS